MRKIFRPAAKSILKRFGYSILKQQDGIPVDSIPPLDHELDSSECDSIWSGKGFVTKYLNKGRLQFYDALYNHIRSRVDIHNFTSVVDVGCGPGYLLKLFAERSPGARLVGLDFSPEVLEVASTVCPSATFRKHDIYEELGDVFDLAVCSEVLEHLDYPSKALDQLASSSRNIVLTVPDGRKNTFARHINFWSMRSWEVFLEPYAKWWECETCFLCRDEKIATIMRKRT